MSVSRNDDVSWLMSRYIDLLGMFLLSFVYNQMYSANFGANIESAPFKQIALFGKLKGFDRICSISLKMW